MVGDLDAGGTKPCRARKGVPRVPFVQVLWCSLFDQGACRSHGLGRGAILRNGFVRLRRYVSRRRAATYVDKILKGTGGTGSITPSTGSASSFWEIKLPTLCLIKHPGFAFLQGLQCSASFH